MYNYERPKILTAGYKINYEIKQFNYNNIKANGFFGTVSGTSNYQVSNRLDKMENEIYAIYNKKKFGKLKVGIRFFDWNYFIIFLKIKKGINS